MSPTCTQTSRSPEQVPGSLGSGVDQGGVPCHLQQSPWEPADLGVPQIGEPLRGCVIAPCTGPRNLKDSWTPSFSPPHCLIGYRSKLSSCDWGYLRPSELLGGESLCTRQQRLTSHSQSVSPWSDGRCVGKGRKRVIDVVGVHTHVESRARKLQNCRANRIPS